MKTIDLSNVLAGVRGLSGVKKVFNHMQEGYVEVLNDLSSSLVGSTASYVLLKGCVNAGVGLNYNISAGVILKDGEVYRVAAFVGLAVGAQVPTLQADDVNDNTVEYTDGGVFNTLITKKYRWVLAATGTGLVDFANLVPISTAIGAILTTKSNKALPAWTPLVLKNGWADSGINPLAYRITDQGILHLRGFINSNGATAAEFAELPNLTVGASLSLFFPILNHTDSTINHLEISGGSPTRLNINYVVNKIYAFNIMVPLDAAY